MKLITVSREFGSGGRELAKRLSDALQIPYYDREILTEIARQAELDEDYVNRTLEQGLQPAVPLHFANSFYGPTTAMTAQLFGVQQKILRSLAERGDCVIVGRAADAALAEFHPLRLFVYADEPSKIARCRERAAEGEALSDRVLRREMRRIDKGRASAYALFSSTHWGDKANYDLCINTSHVIIKEMVPSLAVYAERWFQKEV